MKKYIHFVVILAYGFVSPDSIAAELEACGERALSVGVYEDQLLEKMNGHLYLNKLYVRDKDYALFASTIVEQFSEKYRLELCQLKGGKDPNITIAFVNSPLHVWKSESYRKKISEHSARIYRSSVHEDFPGVSEKNLLDSPEPFLSESINYFCRIYSPWMKMGVYLDGNAKKAHAIINWSKRQHIYDQYLLSSKGVEEESFSKSIFFDTYRFYFNDYRDAWFDSKDLEEYRERIEHIPPDLVWLFASSPNVGAYDSTFPDINMVMDHSQVVYSALISNLFDACYKQTDYKEVVIRSILDAGDYVDLSLYKTERAIFPRF